MQLSGSTLLPLQPGRLLMTLQLFSCVQLDNIVPVLCILHHAPLAR